MNEVNVYSFLAVLFFQCVGVYVHWRKMKRGKRATGKFIDYMLADYPGRSVATFVVLLGSAWISASSGTADNINPEVLWALLVNAKLHGASINGIIAALTAGYAIDSIANKGEKESVLR